MRYHLNEKYNRKLKKFYGYYKKGQIPERCPDILSDRHTFLTGHKFIDYRFRYVKRISYVMLTKDWFKHFANHLKGKKCLEIMAGSGWLSHTLRLYGIDSYATDDFSWKYKNPHPVEKIDCLAAIAKYGRDVDYVICTWPYMDNMAARALLRMRKINPNCRFLYIGESYGGCTANDRFFEMAEEDKELNECPHIAKAIESYKTWDGIYDNIAIYK